jgi:hypothetical protein
MVRFLSESGKVADDLRIMAALPPAPFAHEAFRASWRQA